MPKRSFDLGLADATQSPLSPTERSQQRKTERSHEENQERAYVAASRRADRSLEARVQSARMASEIHKKRTGKGFRITEEIVMKEEMYEEEDDNLPRSYKLLSPSMQTASHHMNSRVDAFLANKVTMSKLLATSHDNWQDNDIHKQFAQCFPNVDQQTLNLSRRMSHQMQGQMPQYMSPQMHPQFSQNPAYYASTPSAGASGINSVPPSPLQPTFQSVDYHPGRNHHERGQSVPSLSPVGFAGCDESPLASTPDSCSGLSRPRAIGSHSSSSTISPESPADLPFRPPGSSSAFTSELPPEAKMLMGDFSVTDDFGAHLYNGQDWTNNDGMLTNGSVMINGKMAPPPDFTGDQTSVLMDIPGQLSNTPDESWETFINDSAWAN